MSIIIWIYISFFNIKVFTFICFHCTIKCISKFNEDDHNYSIDNDNNDLISNNDNISSDIDNLFILKKAKDENKINTENKEN